MKKNVIETLQERGFIDAVTSEELARFTDTPQKVYCGFDPTSDSLHLGNLVAIMGLAWFERFGHTPVAIVGGATGLIGDPSGKSQERPLLSAEEIQANLKGIQKDIEKILKKPILLNNFDWFKDFNVLSFLRDVGKHLRMGPMLSRESVKLRMQSEEGMSFTEFCYQILQGYDFYYLNQKNGVTIQLGGSDQWGNIVTGIDLVRKLRGESVYGVTFPLLTRSDGKKFGKSEKGAIWLSPEKLSPYEFYQYLFRLPDADVIRLLAMLTFLEMDEIRAIEKEMKEPNYVANSAQKRLAEEVTRLVHGETGLQLALKTTEAAKPGAKTTLDLATLKELSKEIPTTPAEEQAVVNQKIVDLLATLAVLPSKGEVRRLIKNGGLYLNNERIEDEQAQVTKEHLLQGEWLLFALGKKNKVLIRVTRST